MHMHLLLGITVLATVEHAIPSPPKASPLSSKVIIPRGHEPVSVVHVWDSVVGREPSPLSLILSL